MNAGPYPRQSTDDLTSDAAIGRLRARERRFVAAAITELERLTPKASGLLRALHPYLGHALVVGFTGPPGAGKSTLVNALIAELRRKGRTVGVIAVDPSSPVSGGAILGDRIRMTAALDDDGVFVRSLASRGYLGGLSPAAVRIIDALDAAGYDVIVLETVGTGQNEIDVAEVADVRVVVSAPGLGDDIQAMKSGLLEIADILVVNKADQPGANRTVRSLEMMLHLALPAPSDGHHHDDGHHRGDSHLAEPSGRAMSGWNVPVLQTTATTGAGVDELAGMVDRHRLYLQESGGWAVREHARSLAEIERLLRDRFIDEMVARVPLAEREALVRAVAERRLDPYTAADRLFQATGPFAS